MIYVCYLVPGKDHIAGWVYRSSWRNTNLQNCWFSASARLGWQIGKTEVVHIHSFKNCHTKRKYMGEHLLYITRTGVNATFLTSTKLLRHISWLYACGALGPWRWCGVKRDFGSLRPPSPDWGEHQRWETQQTTRKLQGMVWSDQYLWYVFRLVFKVFGLVF